MTFEMTLTSICSQNGVKPHFCLGTLVVPGSTDRHRGYPDETESTQVRMRLRKTSSHKTRPAPTINPHLTKFYSAGH